MTNILSSLCMIKVGFKSGSCRVVLRLRINFDKLLLFYSGPGQADQRVRVHSEARARFCQNHRPRDIYGVCR